jgi:predicted N-acetyltransferase YhbS
MEIRLATPDDLPRIRALRTSVGWQTHPWAVLDAMREPHARFFIAADPDRPIAIGSGISYGGLGVVGNMVVASDRRREGLGSAVLERVLAFLEERNVERVELFATAEGRPLYERHGFVALQPGTMVEIPASARDRLAAPGSVQRAGAVDLARLAAYDRPRFGGDRTPILAAALEDPARPVLLTKLDGRIAGYAVVRGEAERIGPWLADDITAASALLAAAFGLRRGTDNGAILANAPGENVAGRAWLTSIGAALTRSDGRMARGAPIERQLETVYGNAVGALG